MRSAGILSLALVVALGGCQTMRTAREHIVRAPPRCVDETVPIYFQPGAAELTPDGRRVIGEAAVRARSCAIKGINVMGLADASGDPARNLELSRLRAAAVSAAIANAGLAGAQLEVAADGELGATTPDGRADPLRRRAEVTFHLAPRK